jgi:vacuolar-type H+-ATPase subunit I/STV1
MFNTVTNTSTYTVVDIRKTFEGFSADFRMIAARTGKKATIEVENYLHDIMVWAENKFLKYVDITLIDLSNKPIKAARYSVDENGKAIESARAGNNEWQNIPNTKLMIIVENKSAWNNMTTEEQGKFKQANGFKVSWVPSPIDNSYNHLSKDGAQLYASKGYELQKENFK